ncbi:MAG: single-stranded DNA-binding protein [Lachnospiraceae bacterium]|nr:single-stranded DNA-binding protein [Lachnospiraceae bacterium]
MKITIFISDSQYKEVKKCAIEENISIQDYILKSLPGSKPRLTLAEVEKRIGERIDNEDFRKFSIPQLFSKEEWEKTDSGSHTSVGKQLKRKVTEAPYFVKGKLICFSGTDSANLGFYSVVREHTSIYKCDAVWIKRGEIIEVCSDGKIILDFGNGYEDYTFDDFGHSLFVDVSAAKRKFPKAIVIQ